MTRRRGIPYAFLLPLAAGLMAVGWSGLSPAAGTCLGKVEQFAQERGLSIDPPDAAPNGPGAAPTPDTLGKSGGVIEPPPSQDKSVLEPRGDIHYGMQTMPEVPPQAKPGGGAPGEAKSASDQALLESALIAAKSEAERGNEKDCLERLRQAEQLASRRGK
jgi:hypothetical protein